MEDKLCADLIILPFHNQTLNDITWVLILSLYEI